MNRAWAFTLLFAYALKRIRKLLECERTISTIRSKASPLLFAPNPGIILLARCVFVAPRYGLRGTYLALFFAFFSGPSPAVNLSPNNL